MKLFHRRAAKKLESLRLLSEVGETANLGKIFDDTSFFANRNRVSSNHKFFF